MIRLHNLNQELARVRRELDHHGVCQLEDGAAVLGVSHADNFTVMVSLVFHYRDVSGTWRLLLYRYIWLGEEYITRITSDTEDGLTRAQEFHILDVAERVSGLHAGDGFVKPLWDKIDELVDASEARQPVDFKTVAHVLKQLLIHEFVKKLRAAAQEGEAFRSQLRHRRMPYRRDKAKKLGGDDGGTDRTIR